MLLIFSNLLISSIFFSIVSLVISVGLFLFPISPISTSRSPIFFFLFPISFRKFSISKFSKSSFFVSKSFSNLSFCCDLLTISSISFLIFIFSFSLFDNCSSFLSSLFLFFSLEYYKFF